MCLYSCVVCVYFAHIRFLFCFFVKPSLKMVVKLSSNIACFFFFCINEMHNSINNNNNNDNNDDDDVINIIICNIVGVVVFLLFVIVELLFVYLLYLFICMNDCVIYNFFLYGILMCKCLCCRRVFA